MFKDKEKKIILISITLYAISVAEELSMHLRSSYSQSAVLLRKTPLSPWLTFMGLRRHTDL